jgi:alpha-tubulin suppressor-like RCC1 family protein
VASWGDNSFGELGDGTPTTRPLYGDIAAGSNVVQVAAGRTHNLALRSDGTVWAWGRNDHGQLGRGTVSGGEFGPARVSVLNRVTKISAGRDVALALRSDGIVFAWGSNRFGQAGNGDMSYSPVSVPVKIAGLSQVTGISAGRDSALATEASGISAVTSIWAWGVNDLGQLNLAPSRPVNEIAAGGRITQISASFAHMLALRSDGTVLGLAGQSS